MASKIPSSGHTTPEGEQNSPSYKRSNQENPLAAKIGQIPTQQSCSKKINAEEVDNDNCCTRVLSLIWNYLFGDSTAKTDHKKNDDAPDVTFEDRSLASVIRQPTSQRSPLILSDHHTSMDECFLQCREKFRKFGLEMKVVLPLAKPQYGKIRENIFHHREKEGISLKGNFTEELTAGRVIQGSLGRIFFNRLPLFKGKIETLPQKQKIEAVDTLLKDMLQIEWCLSNEQDSAKLMEALEKNISYKSLVSLMVNFLDVSSESAPEFLWAQEFNPNTCLIEGSIGSENRGDPVFTYFPGIRDVEKCKVAPLG